MKSQVYDHTGKKTTQKDLPESLFGVKVSPMLIAQYIRVYLARQRQATARAKTRGEIALSTAKIYRQKGTGRARHGAKSAPIFVGGGVSHGPTGDQNYQLKLSQKMRHQALRGALTHQASLVSLITGLDKLKNQTKAFETLITKITGDTKKTLIILDQPYPSVIQAASNVQFITLTQAKRLNAYEVLNHAHIIISTESLDQLVPTTSKPITQSISPSKKVSTAKKTTKKA